MRTFRCLPLLTLPLLAQPPVPKPDWGPWAALAGTWVGENGTGQPGQASAGEFSFEYQLDQRIMVRKNFAEYPATKDRPGFRHDDLAPSSRSNPTAFQAVSFEHNSTRMEGWRIPA